MGVIVQGTLGPGAAVRMVIGLVAVLGRSVGLAGCPSSRCNNNSCRGGT